MTVPRLTITSISYPVVVYGAPPRLRLSQVSQYLPKPRASAILGVDRSVNVYLEAYGTHITTPILCALRDSRDSVVWRDTVWLAQRKELASGIVAIPIVKANIGMLMLSAVRPGTTDTVWTPIFMGFGPDFPAISFNDMVSYLRYFATTDWIHRLRTAEPTAQGTIWSDFLRAINSSSTTHEVLRDYFQRIREANVCFHDETGSGEWRLLPSSVALFERLLTLRLTG